uniref:PARG catalytic Macro domain-containing protein n=1 Tax=Araucaria cunninghamii TaxID=56994 RepID=A0A0D6QSN1_ARACU
MPHGTVSFERKVLPVNDNNFSILFPKATYWSESKVPLCAFKVIETGTIEDHEQEALEVDFANKYLGGGALNNGCVQEEIRFMINPELIAGMLFCPVMEDNEAIEIVGAERFSNYEGYASTFRFAGNYIDKRPRDFYGRLETRIVAIDALCYPGHGQFKREKLTREVNKAFCGFLDHESIRGYFKFSRKVGMKEEQLELSDRCQRCRPENKLVSTDAMKENNEVGSLGTTDVQECSSSIENDFYSTLNQKVETAGAPQVKDEGPNDIAQRTSPGREKDGVQDICSCCSEVKIGIATGNWGCGAFRGDVDLKSMLQWLAASEALRPFVLYFTFGEEFSKRLMMFTEWITCHCWTVGELWDMLIEYSSQRLEGKTFDSFFQWVLPQLNGDPRGKSKGRKPYSFCLWHCGKGWLT